MKPRLILAGAMAFTLLAVAIVAARSRTFLGEGSQATLRSLAGPGFVTGGLTMAVGLWLLASGRSQRAASIALVFLGVSQLASAASARGLAHAEAASAVAALGFIVALVMAIRARGRPVH